MAPRITEARRPGCSRRAALLLFWAMLGGTDADYVLDKDATKPSTHAASPVLC